MNVLVYSGSGSTTESVKHTLESLKLFLSPHYAVTSVSESTILNEPWALKTAMLVMPGGADLPYCQVLNGEGNRKITQFIRKGGKFLGICAGGYYGASRCEFEVGTPIEVTGPRELGLYPGTCRGCAYKGFVYESHTGARAVRLRTKEGKSVLNYYNGGGMFADASKQAGVEVLANYENPTDVHDESGDFAAIVHCKVGKGNAILCGTHPEYMPSLLKAFERDEHKEHFENLTRELAEAEEERKGLMRMILEKLGLTVNKDPNLAIPQLTPIYLAATSTDKMDILEHKLAEVVQAPNANSSILGSNPNLPEAAGKGPLVLHDSNDTFYFHSEETDILAMAQDSETHVSDVDSLPKHIQVLRNSLPNTKATPFFNMALYFDSLCGLFPNPTFGAVFGYGEVVSSTSTLLDKNPTLLSRLPTGTTFTASTQIAGRGRGGNVWVNPKGVMASSVLFRIDPATNPQYSSNIVTLQYLCGLVFVESVLCYGTQEYGGPGVGYEDMPIKIKWPNDLYILKPEFFDSMDAAKADNSRLMANDEAMYAKVSGAIVNSQYLENIFYLVWGGGLNVSNEAPTTSLNLVLSRLNELRLAKGLAPLPPFCHELLLAKFMQILNLVYPIFERGGIKPFLPLYYRRWFHTNQKVSVDVAGHKNQFCTVQGITEDYGLLVVTDDRTGERLELQPDGNSFDIFRGMVYKKEK